MKTKRPIWRNEEGFTLTEVVVSTMLVAIGLVSVAAVMVAAANRQNLSQGVTTCTNLGTAQLEQQRAKTYDEVASSTEAFGTIPNFPAYKRETIVTPNADDTLKVVEVKVTNSGGQSVSVETVVSR
jgi:Tfp pilus assembly protein PilV